MGWKISKDRLPDKDTRYANEHDVPVFVISPGDVRPYEAKFKFLEQIFTTISYGVKGMKITVAKPKYWRELFKRPWENQKKKS